MKNKRLCSFDFDSTLSEPTVQKYAKELIYKGCEVHIVTSRYERPDMYSEEAIKAFGIQDLEKEHRHLFEVADEIGIKRKDIHFTNMEYKCNFFAKNLGFIWHLDDSVEELRLINKSKSTIGISVHGNYKNKCNKLLNVW